MNRATLLALTAAVAFSCPAFAQEDGPNVAASGLAPSGTAVRAAHLAGELAALGRQRGDALLLVTAAGLAKSVAARTVERDGEVEPIEGLETVADEAATEPDGWEAMLAEAEKLAPGDETIEGLAEDVRAANTKGKTDGPAYNIATLPAGKRGVFRNVPFEGSRYAEVYVEGTGRSNLDLFIKDGKGHIVCSDTDPSDINYCGWTPKWTGPFTIIVENRGKAANKYKLMTN